MELNRAFVLEIMIATAVFAVTLFSPLSIYSAIGATMFAFFAMKFFNGLGNTVEIRDLMIVIALLQWFIGPILTYLFFQDDQFYSMVVSETEYMSYVFPAAVLFIVGLYLPFWRKRKDEYQLLDQVREKIRKHPNLDLYLIGVGTLGALAEDYVPGFLKFFMFLLGSLRFIGIYFMLLNRRHFKWGIIALMLGWLFLSSLRYGMFHNLLLWLGFMLVIMALIYRFSFGRKILFFVSLFVLVLLIQAVKHEYRNLMQEQQINSMLGKTSLFTNLVGEKLMEPGVLFAERYMNANVNRINQGWIIARIMRYTPRYEPFAGGETIKEGLKSLVPRVLMPGKIEAGGHTYFSRFTGKRLQADTSMNLSILGEAYANFGKGGGAFFMLMLGLFFNLFLNRVYSLTDRYPSLILWLPLIFLQVVKAETDFATVINHLFKATIVVFFVFWGSKKFLGLEL